jgi:hypothetical protein
MFAAAIEPPDESFTTPRIVPAVCANAGVVASIKAKNKIAVNVHAAPRIHLFLSMEHPPSGRFVILAPTGPTVEPPINTPVNSNKTLCTLDTCKNYESEK